MRWSFCLLLSKARHETSCLQANRENVWRVTLHRGVERTARRVIQLHDPLGPFPKVYCMMPVDHSNSARSSIQRFGCRHTGAQLGCLLVFVPVTVTFATALRCFGA